MNKSRTDEVHSHTQHYAIDRVFDGVAYFLMKQRSRFWFARLYLSIDVLITALIAVFAEWSPTREAFVGTGGVFGFAALGVLGSLGLIGILDVVVNDLMPDDRHLRWARHNRWMVFMAIALVFGVFTYSNVTDPYLSVLLPRYIVASIGALMLAALDLMERGEETVHRLRRATDPLE